MKKFFILSITALLSSACEVSPQPIDYGNEACEYCKMTIVDRQHASQLVNSKGKAYKFDAIECMVHYSQEYKETTFELYLINDFQKPGTLIDATRATYLISPNISSPMGANLAGFASEEAAKKAKIKYEGELYNWAFLSERLQNN